MPAVLAGEEHRQKHLRAGLKMKLPKNKTIALFFIAFCRRVFTLYFPSVGYKHVYKKLHYS